jgi:hypothetical protein
MITSKSGIDSGRPAKLLASESGQRIVERALAGKFSNETLVKHGLGVGAKADEDGMRFADQPTIVLAVFAPACRRTYHNGQGSLIPQAVTPEFGKSIVAVVTIDESGWWSEVTDASLGSSPIGSFMRCGNLLLTEKRLDLNQI